MNTFTILAILMMVIALCSAMPSDLREMEGIQVAGNNTLKGCQVSQYILALQHSCGFESIHGLWPDPESTCTYCTTEAFSTSKLSSTTLSKMKKYWPTCQSGTNEDFWSHEWSKHGTCTGMSQDAYFSKGISLYESYNYKCSSNCYICFSPNFTYQNVC